jgi:hypothetical protein
MAKPKGHQGWTVLPHGPIVKLADNLWHVTGDLPGMSLKRTMSVVRLQHGGLILHNPVALDEASMKRLEAWGTPEFLVIPNGWHRLDAKIFKDRYPEARVIAPRGHRGKVEEVVSVDHTYADYCADDPTVTFEHLHGVREAEGAMFVHSTDGTSVVLNDVLFNMDKKRDFLGYAFTTMLGSAPGPRVSRLAKLLLIQDKKALRADFERLARVPDLVRLIVAHEKVASGPAAREALLQAATYL